MKEAADLFIIIIFILGSIGSGQFFLSGQLSEPVFTSAACFWRVSFLLIYGK